MSDHIPFEIQLEIIKKLPVKSLLQFRSVSKRWKFLIDSFEFIAGYKARQTQPNCLLIRHNDLSEPVVISLIDGETFARQEFAPTVHVLDKLFRLTHVIGSSHGLLCLYGYQSPGQCSHVNSGTAMAFLWNPSIRKSVGIVVHRVADAPADVVLGFGVCPVSSNPTIVKITLTIPWVVEVFTLTAGCWRSSSSNLHNKPIKVTSSQITMDKFIYWIAFNRMVATDSTNSLIVSFDMTTEEFGVIGLPDSLANQSRTNLLLSKIRESLVVIEYIGIDDKNVCAVWMMNHGVSNSFTKLFTINTPCVWIKVKAFTENGEPVMEMCHDYDEPTSLVVYEPYGERINNIGFYGDQYDSFFVGSYLETLLLHDQLDCEQRWLFFGILGSETGSYSCFWQCQLGLSYQDYIKSLMDD